MAVSWNYNGSDTLVITLTGLTPNAWHNLSTEESSALVLQADGSGNLTGTFTDIVDPGGAFDDPGSRDHFFGAEVREVVSDVDSTVVKWVACNVFIWGTSSTTGFPFDAIWTYDGATSLSVDYQSVAGFVYRLDWEEIVGGVTTGSSAGPQTGDGTRQTFSITLAFVPDAVPSFVRLFVEDPLSTFPTEDMTGSNRMFVGGSTVLLLGNPYLAPVVPVLVSSPDWRYVVTDRTSAVVTFLDKLATNRQVTYILNQTAVATGDVPSDNPEVKIVHTDGRPYLSFNDRLLYAFRREGHPTPWVVRYAGILMQIDREAQTDQPVSHFTAYDPWQYWKEQRPIVNGIGVLPGKGGLTFSATKGNVIALALLTKSLGAHGSLYADFGQTAFYEGTIEDTDPIDINFQQGMNLGEALTALTDTGSIDIVLKPIYDPINRPGILVEVSMYNQAGSKKNGAIFAWDMPSKSLEGLDLLHDGTQMANKSVAYAGQAGGASPVQTNAASVTHYGEYWLQRSLPGQIAPAAVRLLALAQLLLRRRGKTTLTISPSPERSPVPLNEFDLGDEVPVYASRNFGELLSAGTVGSDGEWSNLQRIYAIPLDISDDDVETVTSMLMTGPFDV